MVMLNKSSHIGIEISANGNAWGLDNCPVCKGVGMINAREFFANLLRLHETICPGCRYYRNTIQCSAWIKLPLPDETIWAFNPDNVCEELQRISLALDALRCSMRLL